MLKELVQTQTCGLNREIEILDEGGQLVVGTRQIALDFEKEHKNVVRAIEDKIKSLTAQNCPVKKLFIPSTFNHRGNEYKEYLLTRDGFTFIVMGFTGPKADGWKLKYIEAFNKMENKLKNPFENLSPELQSIFMLDKKQHQIEVKVKKVETKVDDFIGSSPLFNVECDDLIKTVNSKVKELIGYRTPAYNNRSLRGKIYSDIHYQIRREFGVKSYKAIRRVDLNIAKSIVANYGVPLVLQNEITKLNNQIKFSEVV